MRCVAPLCLLLASPAAALLRSARRAGTEKQAIMAMACSYDKPKLAPFVLSLRQAAGFTGEVHLGVYSDIDADAAAFLYSHGVKTHFEPCDEQRQAEEQSLLQLEHGLDLDEDMVAEGPVKSFFMGSLNQRRWFHYKKWIIDNSIDRVWMLDVRDVIFQADPFVGHTQDFVLFPDDSHLTHWQEVRIRKCVGADVWDAMNATAMPNWCGGTISGSKKGMIDFCDSMIALNEDMQHKRRERKVAFCTTNDQPLLNYMAFKYNMTTYGSFGTRTAYDLWQGQALNMNNLCDELDAHRNSEGQLVDNNGDVIPIVHKWDKCEATTQFVTEKYINAVNSA